jgi:SAM-dependent methyltransferase
MNDVLKLQETLYTSTNPTRRWLHVSRRDWVIAAIERVEAGRNRAIEVGPGSGVYLPMLAKRFREVIAADIEESFLVRAREIAREFSNIEARRSDITKAELPDAHFDLVLCSEVIEHIADSQSALAQIRRILRPDGRLILTTPHRWSTLETTARIALHPFFIPLTRRIYGEAVLELGHINLLTRGHLERQIANAGLRPERRDVIGFYLPGIAEFTGELGLAVQRSLGKLLRGGPMEQLMWTQLYICRPQ